MFLFVQINHKFFIVIFIHQVLLCLKTNKPYIW